MATEIVLLTAEHLDGAAALLAAVMQSPFA
jgi:hypothetical protein